MHTLITHIDRHRIASTLGMMPRTQKRGSTIGPLMQRFLQSVGVKSSEVPPDCVTMNTHVRLRYHSTGEIRDLHLAYPIGPNSRPSQLDQISVLAPVGAALLGSRVGEVIQWQAPGGPQQGTVVEILYQPESNGDPD